MDSNYEFKELHPSESGATVPQRHGSTCTRHATNREPRSTVLMAADLAPCRYSCYAKCYNKKPIQHCTCY
jgi:hypothetical protein